MAKEIIWTATAEEELYDCLNYWSTRNKSNRYSEKLYLLIEEATESIAQYSNSGRTTEYQNFRSVVIREYLLFFEETETQILILCFWDGRQDPEKLTKRLE